MHNQPARFRNTVAAALLVFVCLTSPLLPAGSVRQRLVGIRGAKLWPSTPLFGESGTGVKTGYPHIGLSEIAVFAAKSPR